jgi:hypothetical protein
MGHAQHSHLERKPLNFDSQPAILSPKTAGVIWWILTVLLLASVIAFTFAQLQHNARSTDVTVTCGTGSGEPCGKP